MAPFQRFCLSSAGQDFLVSAAQATNLCIGRTKCESQDVAVFS